MDRYGSRPTWLYGHSTDAHSVRPGRTDMAQANLATPQLHTVSVQDGQILLKTNLATPQLHTVSVQDGQILLKANMATPQLHTVSVQDGQILLKANMAVWPQHRCTQCP